MAIKTLDIEDFIELSKSQPVLDVRSPGEFEHAHVPSAYSFPLFSDEERKIVGTTYKQVSRKDAIKIGLEYFGPNMRSMVEKAERIAEENKTNKLLVHCWRGGMRSAAIAWLLDLYGFEIYLLSGGYKAFRNWVLSYFDNSISMMVLGGYTGSGKTEILHALESKGELIIDLEGIAGHKGSAFGNLGLPIQAGLEKVENNLAIHLKNTKLELEGSNKKWAWVEDESRRIGNINLPEAFFLQLKKSPFILLDVPFEIRLETILKNYGSFTQEQLENSILRIRKRMGDEQNRRAVQFLHENNLRDCFDILLQYYDKFYTKSIQMHNRIPIKLELTSFKPHDIADFLIASSSKLYDTGK